MAAAPIPPDTPEGTTGATTEDWLDFKAQYSAWLETATDEEILAEMVAIPEEGRPLSPSEAWRSYQCELRRRQPSKTTTSRKAAPKKE